MADLEAGPPTTDATSADTQPELSLAEHEAQFGDPQPAESAADADAEPLPAPKRDETGKFVKEKHRAARSQASASDVPRIQELTKRLREAEAERDALKARPAPLAVESGPPPPAPRQPAAETATDKPKIDNFQEYGDYLEALADWKIAEARKQDRETSQREAEAARVTESWRTRVDAAKAKYDDFEQVALIAPTTIPQGSLIDAWILEDTSGADVLYSLQKDPGELSRILALPIFEQVKALSQLALRLSPTREAAGKTGAAPTTPVRVAPRPPTPVLTQAVPAADEPPDPEHASLADHERFFYPKDRRR